LRERQCATGTGEHHRRTFSLSHLCDSEGERRISQHTSDYETLAVEDSHVSDRSGEGVFV